jgi:hypothetical protein
MINYSVFNLVDYAEWLVKNDIGIGGPDLHFMDSKKTLNETIYPLYLKYHGLVPTGPDLQWDNIERNAMPVDALVKLAIEKTNPNYIFWHRREPSFTKEALPAFYANPLAGYEPDS